MLNPTTLTWSHDGKNTDGTAFDSTLFNGWEVQINGTPTISIPIAWNTTGTYTAPISSLSLKTGSYTLALQLLSKNGQNSDWSNAVSFTVDTRKPTAPTKFAVS